MKRIAALLAVVAGLAGTTSMALGPQQAPGAGDFYYYKDTVVRLNRSETEAVARFRPTVPAARRQELIQTPLPGAKLGQAIVSEGRQFQLVSVSAPGIALGPMQSMSDLEFAAPVFYSPETGTRVLPTDEVVVKLRPGGTVDDLNATAASFGLTVLKPMRGTKDEFILRLNDSKAADAVERSRVLYESGLFQWAEPNFIQEYRRQAIPNDPLFGQQWHLRNTGQGGGNAGADVKAAAAWDLEPGNSSIVIAVIDDGVDKTHEDLASSIFVNPGEIAGNGLDDDENGYVDDVSGWDFSNNDIDASPFAASDNHGTAAAGVAAARGNNGIGVSGACQNCRILPVKIFSDGAFAGTSVAADAIRYAAGLADIVNIGWSSAVPSAAIQSAIQEAITTGRGGKGAVVLCASGNSASGYQVISVDTGLPPGTYTFRWEYSKNGAAAGADTAWLSRVEFPGGELVNFESGTLPAGWATGGNAPWTVVTDPAHADEGWGFTRAAKAGLIGPGQTTYLAVTKTVGAGLLRMQTWVSSRQHFAGLRVWIDIDNDGTFDFVTGLFSGVPIVLNGVSYPAAHPESIAVGASSNFDRRSVYSQYGPEVAFVAPSSGGSLAIHTTDRTGAAGDDPGNYTSFSGTSSATPVAAGVAGLILSRNPNLTRAQVLQIMKDTADKVGPEPYVSGRNNKYGFGRLNAHAALLATPVADLPGAFGKSGPATGATGVSTNPTLIWGVSSGAGGYEYCYDTTNDSACASWLSTGTNQSAGLSGLALNTTYFWHVRALNTAGTTHSEGSATAFWSFTTQSPGAPTVTTLAATNVTSGGVRLNATVNPNGSATTAFFQYGLSAGYGTQVAATPAPGSGTSPVAVSAVISGLICSTAYHFRAVASNPAAGAGADVLVTTPPCTAPGLNGAVQALAVDPTSADVVYAGTSNGVYKTVDGGSSWTRVDSGLPYVNIRSLAIDPNDPCTIYAAVDSEDFISNTSAILTVSGDCGATWGFVPGTEPGRVGWSVAVSAGNPAHLYLSQTAGAGTNSITRFTPPSTAEYSQPNLFGNYRLATDPANPCTLYAGDFAGHVSRNTTCSGWNWTDIGALDGGVLSLAVHPTNQATILAGTTTGQIYRKLDAGSPWVSTATVGGPIWSIAYAAEDPLIAYAASDVGNVYKTLDGGGTWAPILTVGSAVTALGVRRSVPSPIYVGGDSFVVSIAPPIGGFGKSAPPNGATYQPLNPTLGWTANSGATGYEYCYDTSNDNACASWVSTGANLGVSLSGLASSTTYYWHVRATDGDGTTYADGGSTAFWSFTTVGTGPPGAFGKTSPANHATGLSTQQTMRWSASSGATSYEYCLDNESVVRNGCPQWVSVGTNLSVSPGLWPNQAFYWQVRAINSAGTTYAEGDSRAEWSFGTGNLPPGGLTKTSPANGATGVSTSPRLDWSDSNFGGYEYCYDTTNDNSCLTWVNIGGATSTVNISGLAGSTTYYWHVRVTAGVDTTYSNGSSTAFWSFTTAAATGAFGKSSPANSATGVSTSPTLSWGLSSGATEYQYCYDTTNDNACANWVSRGTNLSAGISGLEGGTAYYWHVRATNGGGTIYADNGSDAFWSFTTAAGPPNLVTNGDFSNGLTGWLLFATPDMSYIDSNVTNEVFQFYRVPPPSGTTNQAVVFNRTFVALAANTPLVARFDLGNSNSVRKRISALVHDADFSDLFVCTFWLPPNTPLTTYSMTAHTTKTWANLTVAFYAASPGTTGGFYQVDNVSVRQAPGGSTTASLCDDPLAPAPPGGPDSATLLVNGDFATGSLEPWTLFGQVAGSVNGGAFEFTKLAGDPAGVILQPTSQAVAANELLTATFQLGNLSAERQRVTVILHDNDFSDLSACTFWLAPGQALSTYTYRTFATEAWTNATLSFYPATVGETPAIRLDNVTLRRTPSAPTVGTECLEAGSGVMAPVGPPAPVTTATQNEARASGAGHSWETNPAAPGPQHLLVQGIDLRDVTSARLSFDAWLQAAVSTAEVQLSLDGVTWTTVGEIPTSSDWEQVEIDLTPWAGHAIQIRFVFTAGAPTEFLKLRQIRFERAGSGFRVQSSQRQNPER